jgi:hypothetical protein
MSLNNYVFALLASFLLATPCWAESPEATGTSLNSPRALLSSTIPTKVLKPEQSAVMKSIYLEHASLSTYGVNLWKERNAGRDRSNMLVRGGFTKTVMNESDAAGVEFIVSW